MRAISLPLGYQLYNFDVVSSTMDEAHRLARQGAPEKTLVLAARQTKGRGRRGRVWLSSFGNFHLSLLFRPTCSVDICTAFSFILCMAVGNGLRRVLPSHVQVFYKWPNDVVISGGKVGGVLLEAEADEAAGALKWLVGGIGVNVTRAPAPLEVDFPAISLKELGVNVHPKDLLPSFCVALDSLLTLWKAEGFSVIRGLWLKHAYGLGEFLAIKEHAQTLKGTFDGLESDGSLILKTTSGEKKKILSGDVLPLGRGSS